MDSNSLVPLVFGIIAIFSIYKLAIGELETSPFRNPGSDPYPARPNSQSYPIPKKKVATCQFCGRGIVPGLTLANCPGCGAPITPLASELPKVSPPPRPPLGTSVPGPGPSSRLYRTGMEYDLWRKNVSNIAQSMADQIYAGYVDYGVGLGAKAFVEVDELRGDNQVLSTVIKESENHIDPYLEQFVTAGILTPIEAREMAAIPKSRQTYDYVDHALLGKEKR